MPELFKNRILKPTSNDQLYWFLNKILSIKEVTILPFREYDELICFQPKLLKESGIFPIGRNAMSVKYESDDQEYASYCTEMLNKIKNDIHKLEYYGLPPYIKNLYWEEDEGNFYDGGHNTFYFNLEDKPIFEAYIRYLNGEKIETSTKEEINKIDANKFPHKLPRGTNWENFIIKFLDEENVLIKIKQFKHTTNYKEMGFLGRGKDPRPSVAWTFFKVLAKVNGELSIKDKEAKDKYKKQKEELSEVLENYFSIDYDPFYPYHSSIEKGGNSYRIKIVLIPPPITEEKETNSNDNEDDNDSLGIKEYLGDQYI